MLLFLLPLLPASGRVASLGAQARPIVVHGSVRDSAGVPVAGAEVRIVAGRDSTVARASSDAAGHFRVVARVPAGARDLELVVRSIGLHPERRAIRAAPGDSLELSLTLHATPVRLAPVEVTAPARRRNPSYQIGADTIARRMPHRNRNAWDVIARLRPDMRGDRGRHCPPVRHVWVNGQRASLGRSAKDVLEEIRAEHVEEMRYVNCWDTEMPGVAGRDAVYVVLKQGVRHRAFHGTFPVEPDSGRR